MLKNYSNARKFGIAFSWLLVAVCMGIIFRLSHQQSEESAELSLEVMGFFGRIFTKFIEGIGHDTFRSLAHFLEYCGLAALLYNAFLQTFNKPKILMSFAVSVLYCISDEIHQIFIPGRAFQISDILVDSLGSATGIIVCVCLYTIIKKIIASRNPLANG